MPTQMRTFTACMPPAQAPPLCKPSCPPSPPKNMPGWGLSLNTQIMAFACEVNCPSPPLHAHFSGPTPTCTLPPCGPSLALAAASAVVIFEKDLICSHERVQPCESGGFLPHQ